MSNHTFWNDHQREVLAVIADLLIPAGDGMGSASEAGVIPEGIEEIAAIRPDLVTAGHEAVDALGSAVPASVDDVRSALPIHFDQVCELLASAYFLRPDVARRLGYRSRKAIPLDDELLRKTELQRLVGPVVARGNTWRTTPA